MLEKEVEEAVWRYADKLGCIAIKLNGPMDRGKPDRVFFYRGRALIVEFKKPGCMPTELQQSWLERFEKNGLTTHVVDKIGEKVAGFVVLLNQAVNADTSWHPSADLTDAAKLTAGLYGESQCGHAVILGKCFVGNALVDVNDLMLGSAFIGFGQLQIMAAV